MIQDKNTLQGYFQTGDYPTQDQFNDLLDTMFDSKAAPFKRTIIVDQSGPTTGADGSVGKPFQKIQDALDYVQSKETEWNRQIHTDMQYVNEWMYQGFAVDDLTPYKVGQRFIYGETSDSDNILWLGKINSFDLTNKYIFVEKEKDFISSGSYTIGGSPYCRFENTVTIIINEGFYPEDLNFGMLQSGGGLNDLNILSFNGKVNSLGDMIYPSTDPYWGAGNPCRNPTFPINFEGLELNMNNYYGGITRFNGTCFLPVKLHFTKIINNSSVSLFSGLTAPIVDFKCNEYYDYSGFLNTIFVDGCERVSINCKKIESANFSFGFNQAPAFDNKVFFDFKGIKWTSDLTFDLSDGSIWIRTNFLRHNGELNRMGEATYTYLYIFGELSQIIGRGDTFELFNNGNIGSITNTDGDHSFFIKNAGNIGSVNGNASVYSLTLQT